MHDFNENHIQELKEKWKPVLELKLLIHTEKR